MSVPKTIIDYLAENGATYEVRTHPHAETGMGAAAAAALDPAAFAKAVVLHDAEGYFLAVLPAPRRLDVRKLTEEFGYRPELVEEGDMPTLFRDCALGAVPALGPAYGLDCIVDERLRTLSEVYLEAGDHEEIIRLDGTTFRDLMANARWEPISVPADL